MLESNALARTGSISNLDHRASALTTISASGVQNMTTLD